MSSPTTERKRWHLWLVGAILFAVLILPWTRQIYLEWQTLGWGARIMIGLGLGFLTLMLFAAVENG
jgi:hypothetical protein